VDLFSLENKNILITGASSGIGRAIAILCSKANANLTICGRNENRLSETYNSLSDGIHKMIVADLNTDIDLLVDKIDKIDGFVNSAGIVLNKPFKYTTENDLQSIFSTNFFSPFKLTQKLIKKKKISKNSSFVYISSINSGIINNKANSAYSSSKSAINSMVKTLSLEYAPNYRFNCILPGMVKTEMLNEFYKSYSTEQILEDQKKYPLGYGYPEDVAYSTVFLLSNASKWMTGNLLILDGGFSLS
jgi:NAD(P)-dependent dehydrogenase (short-subunit alcohol dehydrogenase family)